MKNQYGEDYKKITANHNNNNNYYKNKNIKELKLLTRE